MIVSNSLAKLRSKAKAEQQLDEPSGHYIDKTSGISVRKPLRKLAPVGNNPDKELSHELKIIRGNAPGLARLLLQIHHSEDASVPAIVQEALSLARKTVLLLENPKVSMLLRQERTQQLKSSMADSFVDKVTEARVDTFVGMAIKGDVQEVIRRIDSRHITNIDGFHSTLLYNALQGAAAFGHNSVVQELIRRGATVNIKDKNHGNTPLHYAAQSGRLNVVETLKQGGAVIPAYNLLNEKPSDLAREYHKYEAEVLLREVVPACTDLHTTSVAARVATLQWTEQNVNVDMPPIDLVEFRYKMLKDVVITHPSPDEELALGRNDDDPNVNHWQSHTVDAAPPYKLHGIFPASLYAVSVRFHNAADYSDSVSYTAGGGWSKYSTTTIFRTQDAPPSKPGPATMFSTTSTSITIEWAPPRYANGSEVIQYDIQYSISPLDDMHDQSMARLQEMEWVRVYHKVYVSRGEDGDVIEEGGLSGDQKQIYMLPSHTTRYTSFGLTPYTYYFFRVRALNDDGWGEWSRVGEPILATDAVGFTNITPHSVKLHWQQPRDCVVMGYELQQRFADADRWHTLSNTIVPEPLEYLVFNLEPATEYQFRLRALEPSGWRSWHNAAYSRVIETLAREPDPPGKPETTAIYYDKITVSFAKSNLNGAWINQYEVLARIMDTQEWSSKVRIAVDPTGTMQVPTCTFNHLEPNVSYEVKARAHNKLGWSDFGDVSEPIQTRATRPPGAPKLLNQGGSYVELYWDPPENTALRVSSYELQYRHTTLGFSSVRNSSVDRPNDVSEWCDVACKTKEPRGMVPDLRPAMAYQFRVRALTADGWSNYSEESTKIETLRRC